MSTGRTPRRLHPRPLAFAAPGAYLTASVLLFGLPLLRDFSHAYLGRGDAIARGDATLTIWFLAWWPYALAHGLDPLVTRLVWSPQGVDLAWTTSIPGPSVAAAPLTLAFGPVVAYNAVSLLAAPLAAWMAFVLCRHVTKAFWPSLIGGYLFGFSTYELAHLSGNLNLTLVFLVPLAVYLVLLRVDATLRPAPFLVLLTLLLVCQFTLSAEVFATLAVFGGVAWGLALLVTPPDTRRMLRATGALILAAYGLAGLILSPYLLRMLRDVPGNALFPLDTFSSDLLNVVLPTPLTLLAPRVAAAMAQHFTGNLQEQVAYVGLPLCGIVGCYGWARWRTPVGRLLLLVLGIVGLATLGPVLHIAGRPAIALPWALVAHVPLINNALPARFMMYAFLAIAIIVALWLSDRGSGARAKWALALLGVVSLLPSAVSGHWDERPDTPPFFSEGLYRSYLRPGENVLIVPFGSAGSSMLWQAQSGMYFRMAGGYVNPSVPTTSSRWPIVYTLYFGTLMPGYPAQLRAFLAAHGITSIVVVPGPESPQIVVVRGKANEVRVARGVRRAADWPRRLFATLGTTPLAVGGVTVYRVPPSVLADRGGTAAADVDQRAALARWSALIAAANAHLSHGLKLSDLTPLAVEEHGWLPAYWGGFSSAGAGDPARRYWTLNGLWLGPGPDRTVGVGIAGSSRALAPLLERYGPAARAIYFPAPQPWRGQVTGEGLLLMLFTPADIARLAEPD